MLNIVRLRKWFYILTGALVLVTVVMLIVPPRLPWGLEFSSGTSLTVEFLDPPGPISTDDVRDQLLAAGLEDVVVQGTGEQGFFIRTTAIEDDLIPFLEQTFGPVQASSFDSPTDLAVIISFTDPVPEEELRSGFGPSVQGLVVSQASGGGSFISAQDISEAELQEVFSGLEGRFGSLERTDFDAEGDMALTLDFGPEAPLDEFQEALEDAAEGFEVLGVALNAYLVLSLEVTAETREALVPALEERFGRATQIAFEDPADMAVLLTFDAPVDEAELRNELVSQGFGSVVAVSVGENGFALVGKNVPAERQDALLSALRERFGTAQQENFDFASGLALTLDFGRGADATSVQTEVTRLESEAVAASTGENSFFIGGKDIPLERQDSLVSVLEGRFGLATRTPFDFSNAIALRVSFTDPVQLADVVGSLAIAPIQDVLRDPVEVRLVGPNTFLLVGTDLSPESQERILADIEGRVGEVEQSNLDGEEDIALTLDFGPTVSIVDLLDEVFLVEPRAAVETLGAGTFFVGGADIAAERQEEIVEALEEAYGLARRSAFDATEDLALVVTFEPVPGIEQVRSAVGIQGLAGVFVAHANPERTAFFLGGKDISQEHQDALLEGLQGLADTVESSPFDFSTGMALSLDFGETLNEGELEAEVESLGFEEISVLAVGDRGFLLAGRGISPSRQEELLSGVEERFGLSQRTPFDGPEDLAVTVRTTDPERTAEAVGESLIIQKTAPNNFFLAGSGLSSEERGQLLSTLQSGFGPIEQADFNFSRNLASTIVFSQGVTEESITAALTERGYTDLVIVPRGEDTYFLRSQRPPADQKGKIVSNLEREFGPVDPETLEFSFVDAEIARRSVVNTFIAVIGGSVGILLYVWWAFRRSPKPFRFGVTAVVGLAHDVVMVLGAFAVMAKFRGVEIDSLMVIGLLAVIGYSVNNTIVVLDRLRENLARNPGRAFELAVNVSLNETLSRNLNTTLTTALAIVAVLLFGGPTIFNFMLVLLVGVLAGTYSSLFLAANILVSWEKGEIPSIRIPFLRRRAPAYR